MELCAYPLDVGGSVSHFQDQRRRGGTATTRGQQWWSRGFNWQRSSA